MKVEMSAEQLIDGRRIGSKGEELFDPVLSYYEYLKTARSDQSPLSTLAKLYNPKETDKFFLRHFPFLTDDIYLINPRYDAQLANLPESTLIVRQQEGINTRTQTFWSIVDRSRGNQHAHIALCFLEIHAPPTQLTMGELNEDRKHVVDLGKIIGFPFIFPLGSLPAPKKENTQFIEPYVGVVLEKAARIAPLRERSTYITALQELLEMRAFTSMISYGGGDTYALAKQHFALSIAMGLVGLYRRGYGK